MARTAKRQLRDIDQPTGPIIDDPMAWARSYQRDILYAFFILQKRFFVQVHNRKTGKDFLWDQIARIFMLDQFGNRHRSPLIVHVFPKFKTGRETVWDGPCDKGRFIDVVFPPVLRADFSETECFIRLKDGFGTQTGPTWQLQGADVQMQSRRGPNATGVILSEYQDMPETVYEEIYEPMIVSNNGWAAFIGTPHGKNHLHTKLRYAEQEMRKPGSPWFASFKTCLDTRRDAPGEDGSYITSPEAIAEMRARGVDEAIIQQEHYCSFEGVARGGIFAEVLRQAEREKRIGNVPREANMPVGCCLDIGRSDGTAIWYYQTLAREIRLIDYEAFTASHVATSAAIEAIRRIRAHPYIVGRIVLPHDANVKGYSADYSTAEVFKQYFADVRVMEKVAVEQGHEMVRALFSKMYINLDTCGRPQDNNLPSGLDSLRGYHRARNAQTGEYDGEPVHDQYSHGADAIRYGALEGFTPVEAPRDWRTEDRPTHAAMAWGPHDALVTRHETRRAVSAIG